MFATYLQFCTRIYEVTGSFPEAVWPSARNVTGLSDEPVTESVVAEFVIYDLFPQLVAELRSELQNESAEYSAWEWFAARSVLARVPGLPETLSVRHLLHALTSLWRVVVASSNGAAIADSIVLPGDRSLVGAIAAGKGGSAPSAGSQVTLERLKASQVGWQTLVRNESARVREAIAAGQEAAELAVRHQAAAAEDLTQRYRLFIPPGFLLFAFAAGVEDASAENFGSLVPRALAVESKEDLHSVGEVLLHEAFPELHDAPSRTENGLPGGARTLLVQKLRNLPAFSRSPAPFVLPRLMASILTEDSKVDLMHTDSSLGSSVGIKESPEWLVDRGLYQFLNQRIELLAALVEEDFEALAGLQNLLEYERYLEQNQVNGEAQQAFMAAVYAQRKFLAELNSLRATDGSLLADQFLPQEDSEG